MRAAGAVDVWAEVRAAGGFITEDTLPRIVEAERLKLLLVRCGGCRFLAPAQDVAKLIRIVEAEGSDYVRDVSVPSRS